MNLVDLFIKICHPRSMRLDVESLRTFLAVVEAGGVTRAAARLKLSQSAVSWKLKRLADRVGRPLTVADARRIELTEDGQALLSHAKKIVGAQDEVVDCFRMDELVGEVRLGITEDMAVDGVARLVARFSRLHPLINISIRMEQSANLRRWLHDRQIDAAFMQVTIDDVDSSDVVMGRDRLV
jgi:DNA-binding transcriptional LysR family regulator